MRHLFVRWVYTELCRSDDFRTKINVGLEFRREQNPKLKNLLQ